MMQANRAMLRGRVSVPPPVDGLPVVTVWLWSPFDWMTEAFAVGVPLVVCSVVDPPAPLATTALWICAPPVEVVPV